MHFAQVIPGVNLPASDGGTNPAELAVNFMLQLAAALALIYILIGAIRLTTSSGDPQSIATGRKTIIFAVVGLVLSVMGMVFASFVQNQAAGVADASDPFFGEGGIITVVVQQLSFAVGVASVIMLIVGGIRYITSGGQPQSAQAARNTIIYSLVGLVIATVAAALVSFVLNRLG